MCIAPENGVERVEDDRTRKSVSGSLQWEYDGIEVLNLNYTGINVQSESSPGKTWDRVVLEEDGLCSYM